MRFVREEMQLIHGEEEFWADRTVFEERRNQEEAEHLNRMQAQLAEEQFFFQFSQEARQQAFQWEMSEGLHMKSGLGLLILNSSNFQGRKTFSRNYA